MKTSRLLLKEPPEDVIRQFKDLYEQTAAQKIGKALAGKPVYGDQPSIRDSEVELAKQHQILKRQENYANSNLSYIRAKIMLGELYDKLSQIESQGLERIFECVNDPLLDSSLIWLAANNGLKNTQKDEFIKNWEEVTQHIGIRHLNTYLRPLVLLGLIHQHPEIINDLDESSSYLPHRHFIQPKDRKTIEDLNMEIASILPSLLPQEITEKIADSEQIIIEDIFSLNPRRLGKYTIPPHVGYNWNSSEPPQSLERQIDELYNNRDTKKEIYEALADCIHVINSAAHKQDRSIVYNNRKFAFRIPRKMYFDVIERALAHYAENQILSVWEETEGKIAPHTHISKYLRMFISNKNDKLEISHKGTTTFYDIDRPFQYHITSTSYLPLIVRTMDKWLKSSSEINARN